MRRLVGAMVVAVFVAGCRTATRVIQEPRVDLEVSGGNRGYLVGTPPPATEPAKTTRQMVETEIEIPSWSQLKPGHGQPVSLGDVAPPETDMSDSASGMPEGAAPGDGRYTVKTGETLWSIAADPAVFGNAHQWRRLYDANRNVLKSPDQLRPGMALRIPQGQQKETHDYAK